MKKIIALFIAVLMLMSIGTVAFADDWTFERKVEIVCPWGLGGGADGTIRPMSLLLQDKLGVPVEVRNETGAGGVNGVESVQGASVSTHQGRSDLVFRPDGQHQCTGLVRAAAAVGGGGRKHPRVG